jgi:protein-disulfide isomerase-like protein with CxxC motif
MQFSLRAGRSRDSPERLATEIACNAVMSASSRISVTQFSDPGCPWAYSARPAHAVLRWRYGDQLDWRLVTIGLTEDASRYIERGYTPAVMAVGNMRFRRYGMPFLLEPRSRVAGTARACRAIVATRLLDPARESAAFRALQLAWFTTTLVLDEDEQIATALQRVEGLDVQAVVASIDDERTIAAYETDRREARSAEGSPTAFQGKARQTDGPVRYSAPSLVFEGPTGERLEAGGFQPVEAYDVLIANLDPTLERRQPAEEPLAALRRFPEGLVTQELAAIMAPGNEPADRAVAERALVELAGTGEVRRTPLADDAIWQIA